MQNNFTDIILQAIGFAPTRDQMELIGKLRDFIFFNKKDIFVLKGYAGTGKTTMMSALIKTLPAFHMRSVLLAPTGRAAKVLSLFSNKKAFTIHKHIYYSHHQTDNFTFLLRENKHKDTLFIVDEASMIGTDQNTNIFARNLLDDLITYVRSGIGCKLIFIGDTAQLPPVGQELSPALDTAYLERHYGIIPEEFLLTEVVRQALDSSILVNASNLRHRIAKENYSLPIFKLLKPDFQFLSSEDFEGELQQAYSKYGEDDTIIICRSNKNANIVNNRIRYSILGRESRIDGGDNLMAVKNNYFWLDDSSKMGFIANGDIFKISKIYEYINKYNLQFARVSAHFVDYDDEPEVEMLILLDTLDANKSSLNSDDTQIYEKVFEHYYALLGDKAKAKSETLKDEFFNAVQVKFANCLTCHKSQGGGWSAVFVLQSYMAENSLDKEYFRWLYTAITRAKQVVYLVGFDENFFVS